MTAVSGLCAGSLFPFVMSTEVETSLDISELRWPDNSERFLDFARNDTGRSAKRYAAETGGAESGLRSDAITSGRMRNLSSSEIGVNFDSPFGYAIRV